MVLALVRFEMGKKCKISWNPSFFFFEGKGCMKFCSSKGVVNDERVKFKTCEGTCCHGDLDGQRLMFMLQYISE